MGAFGRIGVVGLGTMGAGIAEVIARGGFPVVGIEVNADALARGRGHLEKSTGRAVKRGRLTAAAQQEILDRVTLSTSFADLSACDLVIEAVPERLELKRRVFAELDKVCRADAVLATNTSSLSVTSIAATTGRPAQIVGVHFFNPAPVMKLVEVISTVLTSSAAVARVAEFVRGLGKTPVTVGDRAGFVANRLLFGYLNQAAAMYDSGHATAADIDTAMTLGAGLPMGPFALMDLIGLDTCLEVLEAIYQETRDRRHAAAPVLRELVAAGLLGRKTGRGFYPYGSTESAAADSSGGLSVGVAGSASAIVLAAFAQAGVDVREAAPGEDLGSLADCDVLIEAGGGRAAGDVGSSVGGGLRIEAGGGQASGDVSPSAVGDLRIEAGGELAAKRTLLANLANVAKPGAVLATLVSGIPVVELAMATERPADVVGLHIPSPDSPLIEIVTTILTSQQAADRAIQLAPTTVRCRDRAGYIVDALRYPYLNDAARMLETSYADANAIDAAMTLGCGYPTGPITDLNRLGPSRAVKVLELLHNATRDPAFTPTPLLKEHAAANRPLR